MGFKINFTEPSLKDLAEVADYSDIYFPATPETMASQLVEHIYLLSRHPKLGSTFARSGHIRKLVHSPFLSYYRVFESRQRIDILHIWHGSRRPPNL